MRSKHLIIIVLVLGLLPTPGLAQEQAPAIFSSSAVNIVLASIIINEIIGPPLTKYAIFMAGEAHLERSGGEDVST